MKRLERAELAGLAFAAGILAGCAVFGLRRSGPGPAPEAPAEPLAVSTEPARARLPASELAPLPERSAEEESRALYYSDLGPDTIDVSGYPTQQRYNYAVYAEVCARCHTLARSINAPTASRGFWELYIMGMRAINRFDKNPRLTKAQTKAILDFLDYDSRQRKVLQRAQFREQTRRLKAKYEPIMAERMRVLQQSRQPVILRDGPR